MPYTALEEPSGKLKGASSIYTANSPDRHLAGMRRTLAFRPELSAKSHGMESLNDDIMP